MHLGAFKKNEIIQHKELYNNIGEWAENREKEAYFLWHDSSDDGCGDKAELIVIDSLKNSSKEWTKDDLDVFTKQNNAIYEEITNHLKNGIQPKSDLVHSSIKKHCEFSKQFHNMSRKVYLAIAEVYSNNQEYIDNIKFFHPDLTAYLVLAMRIYAYTELE